MPTPSPSGRPEADLQRRTRHLGAHYTPHPIVRRAAQAALGPLCRGRSPEEILRLRVLDPAVGSGRFLLAALDILARATGEPDRYRAAVAATCLHGVDIHPDAAAFARRRLAQAAGTLPVALTRCIIAADSLLADIPAAFGVPAFHAVLTNPPWVSYSGRQAGQLPLARRRELARRYRAFQRWPTTHGAFLELAARLLAPGGRASLIVPHQVTHLPGYEATRQAVLAHCRLDPPPEPLGEAAFPGVVQPAAIVHLIRPQDARSRGRHTQTRSSAQRGPGALLQSRPEPSDELTAAILRRVFEHPPAPPGTFRDPGVHTGNSARLIIHDEPAPGRAPVREGRCIQPFALAAPGRWLTVEPRLPEGRYCTIRPLDAYTSTPIVLRQTADRPIAARHGEPTYFRNSVLACGGIPGLDDACLLGLLNSTLIAFVHRHRQADSRQRAFPQVKVAHLQALPIARHAAQLQPLVERIEHTSAERLGHQRQLFETLAATLGCAPRRLARAGNAQTLYHLSAPKLFQALRRLALTRPPRGGRPLPQGEGKERRATQRAVQKAAEVARRAIEPLNADLRRQLSRLDQLVYRIYALREAAIRHLEAAMAPIPPPAR